MQRFGVQINFNCKGDVAKAEALKLLLQGLPSEQEAHAVVQQGLEKHGGEIDLRKQAKLDLSRQIEQIRSRHAGNTRIACFLDILERPACVNRTSIFM